MRSESVNFSGIRQESDFAAFLGLPTKKPVIVNVLLTVGIQCF